MTKKHYKKNKENPKRSMWKISKPFWKRKKRPKKAGERYQSFTEEEKEKKRQYYCKRNKNLSKKQKRKLIEYRRNYYIRHNK